MSTFFVVESSRSTPRITYTCDSCDKRAFTGGRLGWNGPLDWDQRTTDDIVSDLCATCAMPAGESDPAGA